MSAESGVISFESLVPESDGVRYTCMYGEPYMSISDIIKVVCDKEDIGRNDIWKSFTHSHRVSLSEFRRDFSFEGRYQRMQSVIALRGALELIMVLPGDMDVDLRLKVYYTLKQHLSGVSIGIAAVCETFVSDAIANDKRKREVNLDIGYVYGIVSDECYGLIKIGFTHKLCSLNTSCTPHHFVAVAPSFHPCRDERVVHAYFADRREEGEYFEMTVDELQAAFDRLIVPEYEETLKRSL